ncbi:Nitrogenase (molybdenum-iron) alpha chain [Thermosulfurimonas dismutans]|uniref:nitrogenase n=2 Tax=Thermosulfurimonas dismutans TaxID=999894 RepID=A0A179D660_9BACT|nr:Nitrogenase (molybdenum-iron) alpha chain [Thermosulfurimonas dismutans]
MIHAPVGCGYYTWGTRRHLGDVYNWAAPGVLENEANHRRHCYTTAMTEQDIIFGGAEKLKRALLEAFRINPGAQGAIIYNTCSTALIGDDIEQVAREVSAMVGKPVFACASPGFCGVSQSKGHHEFNTQFYRWLLKYREKHPEVCMKEEEKTPYDVNLIGDYNIDWDLVTVVPLFEKLGLRILNVFTGNARLKDLFKLPDAKLNIVHCQRSATYIAELLKEGYEIPFVRVSLFGISQTAKSLRDVAAWFGEEKMKRRAEEIIEEETAAIEKALSWYRERLSGKRVAIYVGAPRVWHWPKVMEELGMEVVACMTTFGHKEDYEKIVQRVKPGTLVIDNPNEFEIEEMIETCKPDLFLTGLKEKYLVRKFGVPTLNSHSYEAGPYAGFRGFVNFARDIYQAVCAPVWRLARNEI